MVKYIKQKQQQEQQLQSLLPPELDTLTVHERGLPKIEGGLPLFRPLEYSCIKRLSVDNTFGSFSETFSQKNSFVRLSPPGGGAGDVG